MIKKTILGIVVLVHLGMLIFLFWPVNGKNGSGEDARELQEKAAPAVDAGKESEPENMEEEDGLPSGGQAEKAPVFTEAQAGAGQAAERASQAASPRMVTMQPFASGYFADLGKQLPQALQKDVARCRAAGIFDVNTHTKLWGKNTDLACPIASLTKMMTALLLMEDLRQRSGEVTLDTMVQVSRAASKIGGRQVWLDPREKFSVEDLLKSMMIRSANDCAYQMGEFLGGGDINAFVKRMNRRAAELNCRHFRFYNCHGLPTDRRQENTGSVNELAYLAERLWQYPELIKWTGTRVDAIRENTGKPFQLVSTNHLLRTCPGTVGLKTGMTNKAGYCLVAICEREHRKVIAVVLGVSAKAGGYRVRDRIAKQLIDWCFSVQL